MGLGLDMHTCLSGFDTIMLPSGLGIMMSTSAFSSLPEDWLEKVLKCSRYQRNLERVCKILDAAPIGAITLGVQQSSHIAVVCRIVSQCSNLRLAAGLAKVVDNSTKQVLK